MADGLLVKFFLHDNGNTEVRLHNLRDLSQSYNLMTLRGEIIKVFPSLHNKMFKITWIDSDQDAITVATDDDLLIAYAEMKGNVKVFHVTVGETSSSEDAAPEPTTGHVVCDSCDQTITANRYKCLQCWNYDLCATCESKKVHQHHYMLRSATVDMPRCIHKMMGMVSKSTFKEHVYVSKEAYKTARHGFKHGGFGRGGFTGQKERKCGQEGSRSENKNECPFFDGMFGAQKQHEATAGVVPDIFLEKAGYVLRDILVNCGILGDQQPGASTPNQQANAEKPAAAASTSAPATPQTVSSGSSTPMEIDPKQDGIYPKIPTEVAPEPGWAFVLSQDVPSAPVQPQPQQPVQPQQQQQESAQSLPQFKLPEQQQELEPKILEGLTALMEMGFSNTDLLISLLKRFDGSVPQVVKYLFQSE